VRANPGADRDLTVALTGAELAAVRALADAVSVLAERPLEEADGIVAAVELALSRLLDDFDLPAEERQGVEAARAALRQGWIRGNACL
jgi:hypothetical protein